MSEEKIQFLVQVAGDESEVKEAIKRIQIAMEMFNVSVALSGPAIIVQNETPALRASREGD